MDSDLFATLRRPKRPVCTHCGQRFGLAILAFWLGGGTIPCTQPDHEWKETA